MILNFAQELNNANQNHAIVQNPYKANQDDQFSWPDADEDKTTRQEAIGAISK